MFVIVVFIDNFFRTYKKLKKKTGFSSKNF